MFEVLRKLVKVRDVVLKVNREYIKSAAQADAYRTEPPFKLQGSYRNMNRIAEKVVAIMNDEELNTTILSSYEQDAQTLTRDGESNMLKFRELLGIQTEQDKTRWDQIRYAYVENVRTSSIQGDDQVAQVLKTMIGLRDGLESIRRTIAEAIAQQNSQTDKALMSQSINAFQSKLEMLAGSYHKDSCRWSPTGSQCHFCSDQKVLVQHTVPRVMTDLIRSQFQLLYDGLKPILESSTMQTATMQRLQKAMEECVLQYQAMQKEIRRRRTSRWLNDFRIVATSLTSHDFLSDTIAFPPLAFGSTLPQARGSRECGYHCQAVEHSRFQRRIDDSRCAATICLVAIR